MNFINGHIDIERAWEIVEDHWESGIVKVGIFDSGLDWGHPDFSWDGSGNFAGSVVKGGKLYKASGNVEISNLNTPEIRDFISHGTAVAGIIGAIRNNAIGVAGIAGGDRDANKKGIDLYAFKLGEGQTPSISDAINAIYESVIQYRIDLGNYSFAGSATAFPSGVFQAFVDQIDFAWRFGTVNVASRGNFTSSSIGFSSNPLYPSSFDDPKIISVGGSGINGNRVTTLSEGGSGLVYDSYYGQNMDIIAPGVPELVTTIKRFDYNLSYSFDGTSASAPHATGVAALLMLMQNSEKAYSPPNLCNEDIEFLLQKYAVPVTEDFVGGSGLPVPNEYAGWGRLNVGYVLVVLDYPYYKIHHAALSSFQSSNISTGQNFLNNSPNLIPGLPLSLYSDAERHKLIFNTSHTFPVNTDILDIWSRLHATYGYSSNGVNHTYLPYSEITPIINGNQVSVTAKTYVWKIVNNGNTYRYPCTPGEARIAYSIHLYNPSGELNVTEIQDDMSFSVHPNSSDGDVNIRFTNESNTEYHLLVTDITGKTVLTEKITTSHYTLDGSHLKSGMYLMQLSNNEKVFTHKIIIQ